MPDHRDRRRSWEAIAALLATIILQVVFGLFLSVQGRGVPTPAVTKDFRSTLTWHARTPAQRPPLPLPTRTPSPPNPHRKAPAAPPRSVSTAQLAMQSSGTVAQANQPAPRLVLTVPSSTPPPAFQPQMMEDARSPRPYQQTRFAKAWTPDGGAIQKTWAHRSRAAHLLLSATGALQLPCTDEEKRRRTPGCTGAQYEGSD